MGAITENRTLLQKADLAVSDLTSSGGLLQTAQAQRFMRLLISEAVVMKLATVVPLRSPTQLIEKIRFGSRILRPGVEGTALAASDRVKPDLSKVQMTAQEFKAEVYLSYESLEDNIEREGLKNTIMSMLTERISLDMDEIIVKGDTASADLTLKVLDGILKQATSNTVNASDTRINKGILRDCVKTMPDEFLRAIARMKFLTSTNAEIDWRDHISDRGTVLGDRALEQRLPVPYNNMDVMAVPMFPENVGTGSHCTNILFLDPKNITVGIWRNIRIQTDEDISAGVVKIVATLRFDVKYAEETAVVKAYNVTAT